MTRLHETSGDHQGHSGQPHALVTGGSSGIGLAIANRLAQTHRVTIVGRDTGKLEAALAKIVSVGGTAAAEAGDLLDEDSPADILDRARQRFGPVRILVNAAGAASSRRIADVDRAFLRRVIEINLVQLHDLSRQVVPDMRAAGGGRIVNIASTAGVIGYPFVSAYVAAKHAVIGLTRAYAIELLRYGITVNAVCPGYTDTPLVAEQVEKLSAETGRTAEDIRAKFAEPMSLGRLIKPEEIAETVAWLVSPLAAAVTGQAIVVAGNEHLAG